MSWIWSRGSRCHWESNLPPRGTFLCPQGTFLCPQGTFLCPRGHLFVPRGHLFMPRGRPMGCPVNFLCSSSAKSSPHLILTFFFEKMLKDYGAGVSLWSNHFGEESTPPLAWTGRNKMPPPRRLEGGEQGVSERPHPLRWRSSLRSSGSTRNYAASPDGSQWAVTRR